MEVEDAHQHGHVSVSVDWVFAFLQYGRGYNRAMLVHLGCTAFGFGSGNFAWPALLA